MIKTIWFKVKWIFLLVALLMILLADWMASVDFILFDNKITCACQLAMLSLFAYTMDLVIKQFIDCVRGGWKKWKNYLESFIALLLALNVLTIFCTQGGTWTELHQLDLVTYNVIIFLYLGLAVFDCYYRYKQKKNKKN
ncbi:hypothetical protein G6R29_05290 [Fructobacillus sp. M2-14]|uniref:Uncharacterized protein n=1 Tax=Fructobacillus broussonetiae TaxID=2713173 RepID=A0ABS5R0Q7_9LACO|nr:hypothetical protein [Fructobacillus broussonetiae]MBS9339034.1 hypothetical protein [Fructobacillus broussonetiae]